MREYTPKIASRIFSNNFNMIHKKIVILLYYNIFGFENNFTTNAACILLNS